MNTAQDRANRIAAVTVRSRDLFWIFSITAVMHFVVFGIIAFGSTTANLPITVFIWWYHRQSTNHCFYNLRYYYWYNGKSGLSGRY